MNEEAHPAFLGWRVSINVTAVSLGMLAAVGIATLHLLGE
jgi:hypothetical protein